MTGINPYDELPYVSFPVESSAPERLALASLLHDGPRPPREVYRVLELGCGSGANLLPLAYYRRHATFVGVDSARSAITMAKAHKAELDLANLEFIQSDFLTAADKLTNQFDFIIAHGVVSWVPDVVRDGLFDLCRRLLHPEGLLYLSYNARPGWDVRGLVRDFLLAQTKDLSGLHARAERAREVSAKFASSLRAAADHPYVRLMEREFGLVCENGPAYVAHEYLAPDNHAYWRSEFLALAERYGFVHVADADFNRDSGRLPDGVPELVAAVGLVGPPLDAVDLLSFRQFHSPIFTHASWVPRAASPGEWEDLFVASCLAPLPVEGPGPHLFRHPSGIEVGAREPRVWTALERLHPLWPRGLRAGDLFVDTNLVVEDLRWLQRKGFIELRLVEPGAFGVPSQPLNDGEHRWGGYRTTPYHTRRPEDPDR